MAVQTGEGVIEIIYGSTSIPAGASNLGSYLARPDGEGEWPTVLLFGPEPVPLSSVKNLCRVLARHGIAAVAPHMTENHGANAVAASQVAAFISDPAGSWSNAQFGFGVLAFGAGIHDASTLAARDGRAVAFASVAGTLDEAVVDALSVAGIVGLWVGSRADDSTDVEMSVGAKDALPQTTFVIHSDAAAGFWDDGAEGFDDDIATDTFDRVIEFFSAELPPRV
ncbi:MAG: hypothetical protein QGM46_10145 [Actinomycetota bacterium]|nr:hypothetical protein [Actinomycetota bacterium]MDK1017128.1 hypothetical protein [Actinomycetota bacterium]MDK1026984.1 hypothetical protein [Actinomycetota bacterium]MDK1039375.1 hypothetical protein [Actinomycetota bacterium]MDK1097111.1 hypothetical protein [Actinomycetota bacterium]